MSEEVYFFPSDRNESSDIIAEKTHKVFSKLGLFRDITTGDFVALKIHFGEQENTGFIKPVWLAEVVKDLLKRKSRPFYTDSNTLYVGSRSNAVDHLRLAGQHGFSLKETRIPVVIADGLIGRDDFEVSVNLPHVKSAKIAGAFKDSDYLLCLNHFTGHLSTGFGSAIKNLGMGCASRAGKLEQHSHVHPWINPKVCTNCGTCLEYCPADAIVQEEDNAVILEDKCIGCGECVVVCSYNAAKFRWDSDFKRVQEKMSEYAFSTWSLYKKKAGFMSFLMKVTKDCDCMAKDQPVIVEDIGILGSNDLVALDKASVDMIIKKAGRDVLRDGYDVDWNIQLEHAEKIGLGRREYKLVELS
ncbi:MAG: DUF362 domain-containing protein [Candidatus Aminicenantes bacterium]|nr:DUF362 domain-containing protein [Candidatus Aminicenantes bacterium]